MRTITVTFDVDVPRDSKEEDIQKWLEFELGANGELSLDNPLSNEDISAIFSSVDFQ